MAATLILCCFSASAFAASDSSDGRLEFSGGSFKILAISDTQDDMYPSPDMINFLTEAIKKESPDLIVFTGDLVEDSRAIDFFSDSQVGKEGVTVKNSSGEIDHDKTLANVEIAADKVLSVFEKFGVPYAIAQGNNDHKCGITNEDWLEIYSRYPGCLVFDESEDADGRIDYHLEIKGSDGSDKFNLWMMDSGRGGVSEESLEWYRAKSTELTEANGGEPVPAFAFQHIQAPDVGNLFEECSFYDEGARSANGKSYRLNRDVAKGKSFYAWTPCEPSDEFTAWKEQGDVIGAYFGHQHVEGFTGTVDGIELGFIYGCEFTKVGPYGYRVFTLSEDNVTDYENVVYQYKGSVKFNNWKFEQEEYAPYREYSNIFEKIIFGAYNTFGSIVSAIIGIFA